MTVLSCYDSKLTVEQYQAGIRPSSSLLPTSRGVMAPNFVMPGVELSWVVGSGNFSSDRS